MKDLKQRRCECCRHWARLNPDDLSAPEGTCSCPKWRGPLWLDGKFPTFGYRPATLQRDNYELFIKAKVALP